MKLNPELRRQLIECAGSDTVALVDNACELLTAKIVIWLKRRQKSLKERRDKLPLGDPGANLLTAQIWALGEALVELAEAP